MNLFELPEDLQRLIENDTIDFVTKAKRNFIIKKSMILIFFGTALTASLVFLLQRLLTHCLPLNLYQCKV